jgi:hypothetical protein
MKSKSPPPEAEPKDARDVRRALEDALAEVGELRDNREAREAELAALTMRSHEQELELKRLRDDVAILTVYRKLADARGSVIERLMREAGDLPDRGPRRAGPRLATKRKAAS